MTDYHGTCNENAALHILILAPVLTKENRDEAEAHVSKMWEWWGPWFLTSSAGVKKDEVGLHFCVGGGLGRGMYIGRCLLCNCVYIFSYHSQFLFHTVKFLSYSSSLEFNHHYLQDP